MPSTKPIFTLRLNPDILAKLKYIADDNFRPINSELTMLVLKHIAAYEAEHGEIKLAENE